VKVLVTGATGKVGNAVVRKLVERGDEIVALVRDIEAARKVLPDGVTPVRGDVRDPSSCERAAQGAEAVFNCMGIYEQWLRDPGTFEAVNAEGARNVVRAARAVGSRRVVHTSTFDVFHAEQGGTVDETKLADYPKGTAYERSKQHAEQLVLEQAGDDTEVVIVNPSGVYGPGPWAGSGIDSAMRDAIRRRLPLCPPGGISLGFIEAVADGHLAALDRGRPGERYILGGPFATVREVCEIAVAEAGRGWVPPSIPESVAKGISATGEAVARVIKRPPLLPEGQLHFLLWQARTDTAKAERELGYAPVSLREGIGATVRWMRDSGRI
jgi:dihydroflavonol-4-reductase